MWWWDHPRSRGVYRLCVRSTAWIMGSSPLARGLRSRRPGGCSRGRIIPARAGFTYQWVEALTLGSDHPRSRGVYLTRSPIGSGTLGSSPLARGLRAPRPGWRVTGGIIPARAGFTQGPPGPRRRAQDHPRSRGVYTCGSLESQRTHTLPDPCCLHCRPRARSAGSRQRRRVRGGALRCWTCWTRLGRCGASVPVRTPPRHAQTSGNDVRLGRVA